jgi:hypothetical protein
MRSTLEFYARPGGITELGEYAADTAAWPTDIPALCQVAQGLLLHPFEAHRDSVRKFLYFAPLADPYL